MFGIAPTVILVVAVLLGSNIVSFTIGFIAGWW